MQSPGVHLVFSPHYWGLHFSTLTPHQVPYHSFFIPFKWTCLRHLWQVTITITGLEKESNVIERPGEKQSANSGILPSTENPEFGDPSNWEIAGISPQNLDLRFQWNFLSSKNIIPRSCLANWVISSMLWICFKFPLFTLIYFCIKCFSLPTTQMWCMIF